MLSSATQHAMPPEFDRKWGTECRNTRFPLFTLLCAEYSVKLIFFIYSYTLYKEITLKSPYAIIYRLLVYDILVSFPLVSPISVRYKTEI